MRRSAALLAIALGAAGLVPAVPAAAAKPTHVAIVIAGHGVACVAWHSGITGDDVLNAVATVEYRPTDGLITQIDGQPKNNRADETHYWSYWHNTGSGWRYSTSGASSYLPRAGTVEGWHFINGSSTATPPPVRTYGSVCHDTASVPPPAPTTARAATPPSAPATHSNAAAHSSATAVTRPTAITSARSSTGARLRAGSTGASGAAPTVSGAASGHFALPTLQARNTADGTHHSTEGSALPTVLVLVLVLLLGGAAAFVAQRRRRST